MRKPLRVIAALALTGALLFGSGSVVRADDGGFCEGCNGFFFFGPEEFAFFTPAPDAGFEFFTPNQVLFGGFGTTVVVPDGGLFSVGLPFLLSGDANLAVSYSGLEVLAIGSDFPGFVVPNEVILNFRSEDQGSDFGF